MSKEVGGLVGSRREKGARSAPTARRSGPSRDLGKDPDGCLERRLLPLLRLPRGLRPAKEGASELSVHWGRRDREICGGAPLWWRPDEREWLTRAKS